MEKYKELIGKKINLVLNNEAITSYKITMINPNPVTIEGIGEAYRCSCEWENPEIASGPFMDFDVNTLEELITKKESISPIMPNMKFVVEG